jgi:hypothetical protein
MMKLLSLAVALSLLVAGGANAQSAAPAGTPPVSQSPAAEPQVGRSGVEPAPAQESETATDTPATADACIAAAAELGQVAEGKTYAEETVEKLDELFTKLESLCDDKQFDEAVTVATDIKTMLDGN